MSQEELKNNKQKREKEKKQKRALEMETAEGSK